MISRWLHPFVLVRKYVKPEKIGSIWINPAWRVDNSRSLWEVVETTPKATEVLGYELEPNWILVTPPNAGPLFETREDEDGFFEVFLLWATSIVKAIPWTLDASEIHMQKGTLWVRPEHPETSSLIVQVEPGRETQGTVLRVGEDVRDVEDRDRVAFTEHVGVELEIEGEKVLVLKEEDVLAILGDGGETE